jgi:protein-tyrosine phosphatase
MYVYWPIEDEDQMPDETSVRGLSSFVARLIDERKDVLVHCRSGHNRSGMVCARSLIELGWKPDDAIQAVRDGRSDGKALTNQTFVDWLLEEG